MRASVWTAILAVSLVAVLCRAQAARPLGEADPVAGIVLVRPFVLDEPYTYSMTKDPFEVRSGSVVVLDVDRALARPREVGMPVLYAGSLPIELANPGFIDGRVIGIVPSVVPLRLAPLYFGSDELPERVGPRRGEEELAAARSAGIKPVPAEEFDAALARGGDALHVANHSLLYAALSDLILAHAPADSDWAEGYRISSR
jgi:hypothetical protein